MHKEVHFAFHCHVVDAVKSSSDEIAFCDDWPSGRSSLKYEGRNNPKKIISNDVEVDVIYVDFDCAIWRPSLQNQLLQLNCMRKGIEERE